MIVIILLVIGFSALYRLSDARLEISVYRVEEGAILILSGLIGAVLTFIISINLGLGAVIGSAFVGLVASIFFPFSSKLKNIGIVVYCGSFVGMSTVIVLPSILLVALAGGIAGFIFYILKHTYIGVGGKLGSIALVAVSITAVIINLIHK